MVLLSLAGLTMFPCTEIHPCPLTAAGRHENLLHVGGGARHGTARGADRSPPLSIQQLRGAARGDRRAARGRLLPVRRRRGRRARQLVRAARLRRGPHDHGSGTCAALVRNVRVRGFTSCRFNTSSAFQIDAGSNTYVHFPIVPTTIGDVTVKLSAYSFLDHDFEELTISVSVSSFVLDLKKAATNT